MKKVLPFSMIWVLALLTSGLLRSQIIFSRFDFNLFPYLSASIGPDGTSMDPDVVGDGTAIYTNANCGAVKGIDMTIPNSFGIFDQPSMGMTFRFRKLESRSDFFVRGGTSFYQDGGNLYVSYRTSNGAGGFIDYGPYNTGLTLNEDGQYHEYTFIYRAPTGLATVTVDGGLVWSQDGPDNRDFYWTGAPDAIVGTVMDGNCNGVGILDYAYFFIPDIILDASFQNFTVTAVENDVQLDWAISSENPTHPYQVERSKNGIDFAVVGTQFPNDATHYTFTDVAPGMGQFFYRIRQMDSNGEYSSTEVQTVTLGLHGQPSMELWPNPVPNTASLTVSLSHVQGGARLTVMDLKGSILLEAPAHSTVTTLDLAGMNAGLYLLRCECGEETLIRKVVVQ